MGAHLGVSLAFGRSWVELYFDPTSAGAVFDAALLFLLQDVLVSPESCRSLALEGVSPLMPPVRLGLFSLLCHFFLPP